MRKSNALISIGLVLAFLQSSCVKKVSPVSGSLEPDGGKEEQTIRPSDSLREGDIESVGGSPGEFSLGMEDIRDAEIGEEGIRVEKIEEDRRENRIGAGLTKDPSRVNLVDVFFDYNRAVLKSHAEGMLRENARNILLNPALKILISGHTDERGSNEYNLALGERRARTVKKFLVAFGIESSQIEIISFGEEKPFCKESEERCWKHNRRAHFMVKQGE